MSQEEQRRSLHITLRKQVPVSIKNGCKCQANRIGYILSWEKIKTFRKQAP